MINVLLFNIAKDKEKRLAALFSHLRLTYAAVPPHAFLQSIGKLCGAPSHENDADGFGFPFTEEMLVLCGLSESGLDLLLAALRQTGNGVLLKAVLTESNAAWSAAMLCAALKEEDAALRKNR